MRFRSLPPKRRRLLLAAAALLIVTVLRETGLLRITLYRSSHDLSTGATSLWSGTRPKKPADGQPVRYAAAYRGDPVIGKAIQEALGPSAGGDPNRVRVTVTEASVRGLYWLPLRKSGRCGFSVDLVGEGPQLRGYKGTLSGTLDLTVTGLCSAYDFRRIVGKEIAGDIAGKVSRDL